MTFSDFFYLHTFPPQFNNLKFGENYSWENIISSLDSLTSPDVTFSTDQLMDTHKDISYLQTHLVKITNAFGRQNVFLKQRDRTFNTTRYSPWACALHWTSSSSLQSLACARQKPRARVAAKERSCRWSPGHDDEDHVTYAYPGMFESFRGRDALAGIHRQHLVDEVLRLRSDRVPFRAGVLQRNVGQNIHQVSVTSGVSKHLRREGNRQRKTEWLTS